MMKRLAVSSGIVLVLFVVGLSLTASNPGFAAAPESESRQQGDPEVRTATHDQTGMLSFLGADPASPIAVQAGLGEGVGDEERARAALNVYGEEFGLKDPGQELTLMRINTPDDGRASVRYQQVYEGVPIVAGELIVNMDAGGQLLSISGEISPDLSLSTTPLLTTEEASSIARTAVAKWYGLDEGEIETTDPELWIYDERLLRWSERPQELVWRMDVSPSGLSSIKELVLVNAEIGGISLHFNQIDTVLNRSIYDNQNNVAFGLPGNGPVRTEGGLPHAESDVNDAYDYSGDTYDFFMTNHGRDSLDGAGMGLVSTVRYCQSGSPCPFANAFWNGSQMVYGEGYAMGDDVVGHELTHGVTDFTSHLFYYYQSGAINESFSDVWGELIDLTNGAGNDSAGVRWLMGEDIPIGAIRDMSDPPAFSDPDQIVSGLYFCGEADSGGVHSNSGVNNKTAYLLVDGDTFNGKTVTPIGVAKTADLYYEVESNLLTSGSNYKDLYNAMTQASFNLGLTSAERQEVQDALLATEMDQRPCGDPVEAPVCASGNPVNLFFDDLENIASGNWTSAADVGSNEWYYPQTANPYLFDATYASSGIYNLWGYNQPSTGDFNIQMTSDVLLPTNAQMHFEHDWAFEDFGSTTYDGGVLEYSTTGGASWNDAAALFTDNGYTGTINSGFGNPLGGRAAFTAESRGYTASRLDLSSLSGQNVRFRFRIGTDSSIDALGWFIDDVRIYLCSTDEVYLPVITR